MCSPSMYIFHRDHWPILLFSHLTHMSKYDSLPNSILPKKTSTHLEISDHPNEYLNSQEYTMYIHAYQYILYI